MALALGLLLLAAPVARASEEEYDDDDEEAGAAAGNDDEKDVVILTTKNWDDIVKTSKFALVEFYAPWCGHCKTLKPHYAAAATTIKAIDPNIIIGKVDATIESELGSQFDVKGYPTLKWFVDGELSGDYNGGRDEEGLVKWVRKKTGPPAIVVDDVKALQELESQNPIVVVGFFKAFEGASFEDFVGVAAKLEDVVFVQTTSADVASSVGLNDKNTITIIKNFPGTDRETLPYSGDSAEALQSWIKGEKLPLTIEFNSENSEKIFNSGINQQVLLWAKAADLEPTAELLKTLRATALKFKGKLVFVTINNEGDAHEPVTKFFGLENAEAPVVLGFYMEKNKKFKLNGAITEETLDTFAASLVDGTAQPEYKSAPIPESPEDKDGDVQIIVGKTVDTIVKDPTKDVLLEVYAPWCGHCKKLDPIFKKLAKRFRKVDSIVIAKMDGTENEHPEIEVKGFPTLFFFPAGEDQAPIQLEDTERTLKGFTKFLKANAKIEYELPKKGGGDDEDVIKPVKDSDKDEL